MKLNLKNINQFSIKNNYNIENLRKETLNKPKWIHFGVGNIFRGYIARINNDMLNKKLYDSGIIGINRRKYEDELDIFEPHDNLTLSVSIDKLGNKKNDIISNIYPIYYLDNDMSEIEKIFLYNKLQLITFTITEKGYKIYDKDNKFLDTIKEDLENNPRDSKNMISQLTYLLYCRFKKDESPVTLLSLDNLSNNGEVLKKSIITLAKEWINNNFMDKDFLDYLENESKISFPISMIDKITPEPTEEIENYLKSIGFEDIDRIKKNNSYIAPYVNLEIKEYLAIEDKFTNGRPPFEEVGVYVTDKKNVKQMENMKVTACLNPLHTALAIFGCLLGYDYISDEMKDKELVKLIKKLGYDEAFPVVTKPDIINPLEFLDEVVEERLPNPYLKDTPQRIATDTSQKISVRFGETIKSYRNSEAKEVNDLVGIPLVIAGWFRYLLEIDDKGNKFKASPDPLLDDLSKTIKEVYKEKNFEKLYELLKNESIFGIDIVEVGLGERIVSYFKEMISDSGSVRKTLKKHLE